MDRTSEFFLLVDKYVAESTNIPQKPIKSKPINTTPQELVTFTNISSNITRSLVDCSKKIEKLENESNSIGVFDVSISEETINNLSTLISGDLMEITKNLKVMEKIIADSKNNRHLNEQTILHCTVIYEYLTQVSFDQEKKLKKILKTRNEVYINF
jgi:hypothetical protein